MNNYFLNVLKSFFVLILILISFNISAITITSVKCGDWTDSSTWDLNRSPNSDDTILVNTFVSFDTDFVSLSPGMLNVTLCGTLCGSHDYTGCILFDGIVYMHQVHLNYGNSISNSFDVNVQQMYSVNSGASFVNNGQTCVGCTSQCLNCNVRREGDFDCSGNGIGDVQEFNIQFTPNPASDYLMVTGVTLSTKITIYDLQGRVLMETELVSDETLSLNSLSPGLYMLSYENSAFRRTSRLIVASRR